MWDAPTLSPWSVDQQMENPDHGTVAKVQKNKVYLSTSAIAFVGSGQRLPVSEPGALKWKVIAGG